MWSCEHFMYQICVAGMGIIFVTFLLLGQEHVSRLDILLHRICLACLSGIFLSLTRVIVKEFTIEPPVWFSPVVSAMGEALLKQKFEGFFLKSGSNDDVKEEINHTSEDGKPNQYPMKDQMQSLEGEKKPQTGLQQRKGAKSEEFPLAPKPKLLVSKSLPKELKGNNANESEQQESFEDKSILRSPKDSPKSDEISEFDKHIKSNNKADSEKNKKEDLESKASEAVQKKDVENVTVQSSGEKDKKGRKKKHRNISNLDTITKPKKGADFLPRSTPTSPVSGKSSILTRNLPDSEVKLSGPQKDRKEREKRDGGVDLGAPMTIPSRTARTLQFSNPQTGKAKIEKDSKGSVAWNKSTQLKTSAVEKPLRGILQTKGKEHLKMAEDKGVSAAKDDSSKQPKSPPKQNNAWGSGNAWFSRSKPLIPDQPNSGNLASEIPENPWKATNVSAWSITGQEQAPLLEPNIVPEEVFYSPQSGLQKPPSFADLATNPGGMPWPPPGLTLPPHDLSEMGILASRPVSPFEASGGFGEEINPENYWGMQEELPSFGSSPTLFSQGLLSQSRYPGEYQHGSYLSQNEELQGSFPGFSVFNESVSTDSWAHQELDNRRGIYFNNLVNNGYGGANQASFEFEGLNMVDTVEDQDSPEFGSLTRSKSLPKDSATITQGRDTAEGSSRTNLGGSFWSNNDPKRAFLASFSENPLNKDDGKEDNKDSNK